MGLFLVIKINPFKTLYQPNCIWYRDNYIQECEDAIDDGEGVPDLPDWGKVYNYDELYGDYVREPLEEGEEGFYAPMCVDYYRMYEKAERRDA